MQNPSFEMPDADPTQPLGWTVDSNGGEVMLDTGVAYDGTRSLKLKRIEPGVSKTSQSIEVEDFSSPYICLSGYIKTEDVESGVAAFNLLVYHKQKHKGAVYGDYRSVSGTTPWTRYEIVVPIFPDAQDMTLSFGLTGIGTAWFDAYAIDEIEVETMSPPSAQVNAYLEEAFAIMHKWSVKREFIDWDTLRETVVNLAHGAQTTADTYWLLRYALRQLGDNHSFLSTPEDMERRHSQPESKSTDANAQFSIEGELLLGEFAYVSVPSFISLHADSDIAFADELQSLITRLDAFSPRGWIVDLRSNTGGNMWPMLAGIGPILGEGEAGAFIYPDGQTRPWGYSASDAKVSTKSYQLRTPSPPVAVLTGPNTNSSGEAIAVSFRGRPATKSFGQGTNGCSTSNSVFPLSDGAALMLTTAVFADRTGTVYGGVIQPDQIVESGGQDIPLKEDSVIKVAISWLKTQHSTR